MDTGKNASKKVIHEAVEPTCKFLGNKIVDAVTKSNDVKKTFNRRKFRKCWRNNYITSKKRMNINWIKTSIKRFKTSMFKSDLCGYGNAYIAVKLMITIEKDNDDETKDVWLVV